MKVPARAITVTEFKNALLNAWGEPIPKPWRIGLAVSGGVDSMALAYLSSELSKQDSDGHQFSFTAFIVDHQLRPNSGSDASAASSILRDLGIDRQVHRLSWGDHVVPRATLETTARKFRFEALGRVCVAEEINTLLMAHHRDDQAETTLFRLVEGYGGKGVRGIRSRIDLPQCRGLYGGYSSGGRVDLPRTSASSPQGASDPLRGISPLPYTTDYDTLVSLLRSPFYQQKSHRQTIRIPSESGGIQLVRPLLPFPKARLEATCRDANVRWVEDETNADPTLTRRNAMRHMLTRHALPRALQHDRFVQLSARVDEIWSDYHRTAQALYDACDIVLDVRFGVAYVRLPSPTTQERILRTSNLPSGPAGACAAVRLRNQLVYRIFKLVTCKPFAQIDRKVDAAAAALFPATAEGPLSSSETAESATAVATRAHSTPDDPSTSPTSAKSEAASDPPSSTAWGVQFARMPGETVAASILEPDRSSNGEARPVWRLARQPPARRDPASTPLLVIPPTTPTTDAQPSPPRQWHLFDHRFWFRVRNPSPHRPLLVRLLDPDRDLAHFSAHLNLAHALTLRNALRASTGGPGLRPFPRRSLPVLAAHPSRAADLSENAGPASRIDTAAGAVVIALPTLGIALTPATIATVLADAAVGREGMGTPEGRERWVGLVKEMMLGKEWEELGWEVRYKEVVKGARMRIVGGENGPRWQGKGSEKKPRARYGRSLDSSKTFTRGERAPRQLGKGSEKKPYARQSGAPGSSKDFTHEERALRRGGEEGWI